MLTPDMFLPPLPPLGLDLLHHGPAIHRHDPGATLKQPLVQIIRLPGPLAVVALRGVGAGFEGVVARAEQGRAVQPEHVAGGDAVHVEGEPQGVALREQVGEPVDVRGYVVRLLRG